MLYSQASAPLSLNDLNGDLLPVVLSPASPINWASWAILASVFSSAGRELLKIPSKIVVLISSGFGEFLILRTLFIHHYCASVTLDLEYRIGYESPRYYSMYTHYGLWLKYEH